jgi:hypothetical protein
MKKVIALLLVVTLSVGSLSGCAPKDDQQLTILHGQFIGLAGGAVLGGALGYLIADRPGAVVGVIAGGILGGIAGLFVGRHVADQKAKFASEEAWLDACLLQVERINKELKEYNKDLTASIANMDKHTKELQRAIAARQADEKKLADERRAIAQNKFTTEHVIRVIEKEIAAQQRVLADTQANRRSDESALLEAEIAALLRQKAQLEKAIEQLASMSKRISV